MELNEFEIKSKSYIEEIALKLEIIQHSIIQTTAQIEEVGEVMQNLSELVEDFINQQTTQ